MHEGVKSISTEIKERSKFFELLDSLEGFQRLTEKQQRLIKLSLYIQQRAERDVDELGVEQLPGNANLHTVESVDDTHQYNKSQTHVSDWFCTAAVSAIEKADSFDLETAPADVFDIPIDVSFFRGFIYSQKIDSKNDFLQFVDDVVMRQNPPFLLDIASKNYKGVHSAVVLGSDESGDVMVWEKVARDFPYRISSITELFKKYHHCYWGIRPLRESNHS